MSNEQAYVLYQGESYLLLMLMLDESLQSGIQAELETIIPFDVDTQTWLGRLLRIHCQVSSSTRLFPLKVTHAEIFAKSIDIRFTKA